MARIVEGAFTELKPVTGLVFRPGPGRVEFTDDGRLITGYGELQRDGR